MTGTSEEVERQKKVKLERLGAEAK